MNTRGNDFKVLIAESDPKSLQSIQDQLVAKNKAIHTVSSPWNIVGMLLEYKPAVLILSLHFEAITGLEILRIIRNIRQFKHLPVLLTSAPLKDSALQLQALDEGETSFIQKPINKEQLTLKINLLESSLKESPVTLDTSSYKAGDIEINTIKHESRVHNDRVSLTPTEFKLLKILIERKGRVQTREHLLSYIWGYSAENIETRTV